MVCKVSVLTRHSIFPGMIGIGTGVVATIGSLNPNLETLAQMSAMMGIGGGIGAAISSRIQVSDLPQLVAAFHSFVGLAAVLTALAKFMIDGDNFALDPSGNVHKTAIFLGTYIGGVTFTGSLVAFGKLHGLLNSKALSLPGKNQLNIAMALANVAAMGWYMTSGDNSVCLSMLGNFKTLDLGGFISTFLVYPYLVGVHL